MSLSRRQFAAVLLACVASGASAEPGAPEAGRKLDFKIGSGFGNVPRANIEAVCRSAGESIWRHCPNTRWREPGFYIYRSPLVPITLDEHNVDERISIGLTPLGLNWAQFAFQFAHEFCHALARHSNDWEMERVRRRGPNHWLEESICETASLFALRAMGKSWLTSPPYNNWKGYAPHLTEYAQQRLDQTARTFPPDQGLTGWLVQNEAAMRANPTIREKNNVVASRLLPLFEASPTGWESIPFFNLGRHGPTESLATQFSLWKDAAPAEQHKFIEQVAALFGLNSKLDSQM